MKSAGKRVSAGRARGACRGEFNSFTCTAFESYRPVAFGCLLLTLPISLLSSRCAKKLHFDT